MLRSRPYLLFFLLLVFLALIPATAHSQINLAATPHYAVGNGPRSVAAADLNSDGKPDLVIANSLDGTISILLGNGDGTFRSGITYNVGGNPNFVAVGDFNGDGKPDLAIAILGTLGAPKQLTVLLGNGDGTFQAPLNSPTSDFPVALAIGDFNGDGKLDAAASDSSGGVDILLGNGDGTFKAPLTFSTAQSAASLTTADFNRDGHLDLAVINQGSNSIVLTIYLGNGDGTFNAGFSHTWAGSAKMFGAAAGDLNSDGNVDLVLGNTAGQCVTVLLGNGDGTFQAPADYGAFFSPGAPVIADFNGDGKPDVAITDTATNVVHIFLGNGNGSFQGWRDYAVGLNVGAIAVADFNGDGRSDIVTSNSGSNDVSILLNAAVGFQGARSFSLGVWAGNPTPSLVLADLNGDGNLDFVTGANGILIALGAGDGTFQQPTSLDAGSSNNNTTTTGAVVVADFNGDGHLDLAAPTQLSSGLQNQLIAVLLGNGNGTFQPENDFGAEFLGPEYFGVGDFNGDGKPDIFLTGPAASVSLGNGTGVFPAATIVAGSGGEYSAFVVGDFNGDGHADVLTISGGGATMTLFAGNGDGTFQISAVPYVFNATSSLATGDLNGDGIPDIVTVSGVGSGLVNVLVGKGDGTFQTPVSYAVGNSPQAVAIADLNHDSHPDIIVALRSGAAVVLLGNGDGTFQQAISFGSVFPGGAAVALAVGDVNGDGLPDVLVQQNFGIGTGTVTVLLNQTGRVLAPVTISASSSLNPAATGQAVTLTATITPAGISGSPTGQVTFLDGSSSIGTSTISAGVASLTVSTLTVGNHSLAASYSGDANFAARTSAVITQTINTSPFTATPVSSSATVSAGQSAQFVLNFTSGTAQVQSITLACSNTPPNSTCSISPNPLPLSSVGTASTTVKIQTGQSGRSSMAAMGSSLRLGGSGWALTILTMAFCLFDGRTRRRIRMVPILVFLLALVACGGGNSSSGSSGTPAGNYTIVVTAQSNNSTQKINLTLTVQ